MLRERVIRMLTEALDTGINFYQPHNRRTAIDVRPADPNVVGQIEQALANYFLPQNQTDRYLQQAALIGVSLAQTTFTGFYSDIWNIRIRGPIDPKILLHLPILTYADTFPELYNNPEITSEEFQRGNEKVQDENLALQYALTSTNEPARYFPSISDPDCSYGESNGISECYHQICMRKVYEATQTPHYVHNYVSPPLSQKFKDMGFTRSVEVFCMPTKELLASIATNQVNPLTHQRYTDETQDLIRKKFGLELKLVKYSLQHIPQ